MGAAITLQEIAVAIKQAFSSNTTAIGSLVNCQTLIMRLSLKKGDIYEEKNFSSRSPLQ